jgi:hypothetical protein
MTYLGDRTVEDCLWVGDRQTAEELLQAYSRTVGLFHRLGREALPAIDAARRSRGYTPDQFWPPFAREDEALKTGYVEHGDAPIESLGPELRRVVAETFWDEATATLIQWDCWPGNAMQMRGHTPLIDLENSMQADPLLDVASWHLCFPAAPLRSPWAAALPAHVVTEMDRTYEAATGESIDTRRLALACASRMQFELTASGGRKLISGQLPQRVRLLYAVRLEATAELCRNASVLPTLAASMAAIAAKARGTDLVDAHLNTYPALQT